MVHNIHILFFLYRSKANEKGTMPIFCRLTLNGKRKQFSSSFYLKEDTWNGQTQRYRGTSVNAQHINLGLEAIRIKLLKAYDAPDPQCG
ncbi:Arm DNA-binding domain-containing protein [Mucilaginibacter sp.]|uniref:Arm DNA-binding domain-containing protein n=1 Tax=Mucilaginibacter sp. TaxID=1882438 RepID=UPI00261A6C8D|nr:Arm DNA-binding domain-containing protein [Mucilaginibacter sp.]